MHANLADMKPVMVEELAAACTDDEWSESARTCFASATHLGHIETCR